ncbi:MAG: protein-glutamate O-methyltransferase CheR [Clostridiales bacterium]
MKLSNIGDDKLQLSLSRASFLLYKNFIKEKSGIDIKDNKHYLVETRLNKLLYELNKSSFEHLYYEMVNQRNKNLEIMVIDAITINETYWFRDKFPWKVLTEILLPRYINELRTREKRKIRIWSAAASTGQEAYSTVICINEYLNDNNIKDITLDDFEVFATDLSNKVIEKAKKGEYESNAISRGLNDNYIEKYFRKKGRVWILDSKIKKAVIFKNINLSKDFRVLGYFNVIFCRYVLIYFSKNSKEDVLNRIIELCSKDGIIFFGASEIVNTDNINIRSLKYSNNSYYMRIKNEESIKKIKK